MAAGSRCGDCGNARERTMRGIGWMLRIGGIALAFAGTVSCAGNQPRHAEERRVQSAIQIPAETSEPAFAPPAPPATPAAPPEEYTLGVDDVVQIDLLKPDALTTVSTVAPDGMIHFPYIGNVVMKGRTLSQVREEIQNRLADGYMKYPVVAVSLRESRSRKFYVYGEVIKPGGYPMVENTTTLRAISMAGGFSRFGSASRVKILRPKPKGGKYDMIKVDIKAVMEGHSGEDLFLKPGDVVVVSEGLF